MPVLRSPRLTEPAAGPDVPSELADALLAAAGDARAFERLYRSHAPRVHALARRMLAAEPAEADDATQEVFIRAWQRLAGFRGEARFGTWLHRVAVNLLIERQRSARHRPAPTAGMEALEVVASHGAPPGAGLDFEAAMRRLPDGMREVFVLHDVEGYRHEEIASQLGIAVGTSKSQLHRARLALRRHLDR